MVMDEEEIKRLAKEKTKEFTADARFQIECQDFRNRVILESDSTYRFVQWLKKGIRRLKQTLFLGETKWMITK